MGGDEGAGLALNKNAHNVKPGPGDRTPEEIFPELIRSVEGNMIWRRRAGAQGEAYSAFETPELTGRYMEVYRDTVRDTKIISDYTGTVKMLRMNMDPFCDDYSREKAGINRGSSQCPRYEVPMCFVPTKHDTSASTLVSTVKLSDESQMVGQPIVRTKDHFIDGRLQSPVPVTMICTVPLAHALHNEKCTICAFGPLDVAGKILVTPYQCAAHSQDAGDLIGLRGHKICLDCWKTSVSLYLCLRG